ncbi:MAG: hypothetical protein P794_10030 [Epsilonproteobacteria bacterium (ex Lamellibrachia satsuma)]|nr:MAG: hypothetical protein P794_10030 [Epsilonproteobacteria bacterium (ex Lamellibrachia satsuma)]
MKTFYTLVFLALVGLGIGIATIMYGNQTPKAQTKPIISMQPPFKSYIAGTGIVEAQNTNIPIGSAVSGIVTKVYVKVGEEVKVGDSLFGIDDKQVRARIMLAKKEIKIAQAELLKNKNRFQVLKNLKHVSPELVTKEQYQSRRDDVELAKSELDLAQTKVKQLQNELERYTVHALMDGKILQNKMRKGMYIDKSMTTPLLVLGNKSMNLRISINEYDVWRFQPHAKAVAFVRGHPKLKISLEYNYTKPYIVPKTALTGLSTERTDTRVLQVIYTLKEPDFPLYTGQQLDVFIDAENNGTKGI